MSSAHTDKREVLRLAGLLAAFALATSRLGLIGHELVGHGGIALAFGARITDVKLFWFAGGWILYHLDSPSLAASLAIAMAGIGMELVCGTVLWFAVRGPGLGRTLVRGVGAALILHASWYLATGAFNGFGDGIILYHVLGDARIPVAIAAGVITCVAAYGGARGVFGTLVATLPTRRISGLVTALALAGGLHVALTASELYIRRDPTYVAVMRPERERVVARDLAAWTARQQEQGVEVTATARASEAARLEAEHRTFPFPWLLGIAVAVAVIAGARRTRVSEAIVISRRLLAIATICAAGSIVAVIAIDLVAR